MSQRDIYEGFLKDLSDRDQLYRESTKIFNSIDEQVKEVNKLRAQVYADSNRINQRIFQFLKDTENTIGKTVSKLKTSRKTIPLHKVTYLSPDTHLVVTYDNKIISWFSISYSRVNANQPNTYNYGHNPNGDIVYWGFDTQSRRDWLKNRPNANIQELYPSFFNELKNNLVKPEYYGGYTVTTVTNDTPQKVQPSSFDKIRAINYDAISQDIELTSDELVSLIDNLKNPYKTYKLGAIN